MLVLFSICFMFLGARPAPGGPARGPATVPKNMKNKKNAEKSCMGSVKIGEIGGKQMKNKERNEKKR